MARSDAFMSAIAAAGRHNAIWVARIGRLVLCAVNVFVRMARDIKLDGRAHQRPYIAGNTHDVLPARANCLISQPWVSVQAKVSPLERSSTNAPPPKPFWIGVWLT